LLQDAEAEALSGERSHDDSIGRSTRFAQLVRTGSCVVRRGGHGAGRGPAVG
jgi:hypothetical protein